MNKQIKRSTGIWNVLELITFHCLCILIIPSFHWQPSMSTHLTKRQNDNDNQVKVGIVLEFITPHCFYMLVIPSFHWQPSSPTHLTERERDAVRMCSPSRDPWCWQPRCSGHCSHIGRGSWAMWWHHSDHEDWSHMSLLHQNWKLKNIRYNNCWKTAKSFRVSLSPYMHTITQAVINLLQKHYRWGLVQMKAEIMLDD